MRGMAALLAIGAVWIGVSGVVPRTRVRIRFDGLTLLRAFVSMAGVAVIVAAATGVPAVAMAAGMVAAIVPIDRSLRRASEATWRRLRQWPDILARARSALASGVSVTDGLLDALEGAGEEYEALADGLRRSAVFGDGIAGVVADPSVPTDATTKRILVTLSLAANSGGQRVGEVVGTLSRSIADDIRLREAHRAALTEQRMTVGVALFAPWVMLLLAVTTNPQAAEAFGSAGGTIVIAIGAAATILGWALANRTARISQPPEVFT